MTPASFSQDHLIPMNKEHLGLHAWGNVRLREHDKPLHTLRKEAGSIVCQQRDIYAASRFLRHADIQVTAEHYLDKKERITIGVGGLLSPSTIQGLRGSSPV